ncbi:acyl-CoA synthetase [Aureispira anguillae]|uniref:Acyl-CoA synthetase n=1 Tax=Aureispira anguillae TaxID=2864201 RepID=A0A915YEV1_9BACT|nr:acyl-CoA synthetase [Aureispira anguillae]BDS11745.1 acyl-CoA synthetase [Aureispira anguillae]
MNQKLSLIQRAQQWKTRTAIVSNQQAYNYQQLLDSSALVASHLLGDQTDLAEARVAFLVAPSFEYTAIQWGIWRAGGIAVPLCVLHPLPSLQYVIENTRSSILIVDESQYQLLAPLAKQLGIQLFKTNDLLDSIKLRPLPSIAENRRAMILYTSGTTSLPKGVVTTHANINFQIQTLVTAWEWQKEDHILNILPLHHVHGIINIMSCALWVGACCEFLPKFDAAKVWGLFTEGKINLFMAVPTIYFKLIAHWEKATLTQQQQYSQALQQFRLMVSGSAALPVPILEKWRNISSHTLLERYGMTEIGMGISNSYRGERRAGHIGQALPGIQIRLVNEQGLVHAENIAGEIQIKGPNVFKEYWEKPTATQKAFTPDGWFLSGDIAMLNNGYYKILGRDSVDIIKSGGYKISALEIEDVLRLHPAISDCAIVGIPNEEWGEVVAACLIPIGKTNIKLPALQTWLKERLPAYKIPRQFILQNELPRNVLGKVTKNELKKLF